MTEMSKGQMVEILKGKRAGQQFKIVDTFVAFNGKAQVVLDIPGAPAGHRQLTATSVRAI